MNSCRFVWNPNLWCFSASLCIQPFGMLNSFFEFLAEHCTFWCIAFLHRNEELNSEEATQEEVSKSKNRLGIPEKLLSTVGIVRSGVPKTWGFHCQCSIRYYLVEFFQVKDPKFLYSFPILEIVMLTVPAHRVYCHFGKWMDSNIFHWS